MHRGANCFEHKRLMEMSQPPDLLSSKSVKQTFERTGFMQPSPNTFNLILRDRLTGRRRPEGELLPTRPHARTPGWPAAAPDRPRTTTPGPTCAW
ncbi:Hypothetical predicted protein [Cloeon dipterum]|uniref:Uncharacterized protein n=1 Tax=Cloeon dipterum TaxID=197152 RepID=A0A8S1DFR9_9INSE|nr:Hypothetical predicted protein [Cloeon dipterum]